MKKGIYYLLGVLMIAGASACVKNSAPPSILVTIPTGNFVGNFTLIHKNSKTLKLDTSSAVVTLSMTAAGAYAVGGDTTKIQAASSGLFTIDQPDGLLTFQDITVTKTTSPNTPKKHLNGTYIYTYGYGSSGTPALHIYGSSDTLSYDYALTSY